MGNLKNSWSLPREKVVWLNLLSIHIRNWKITLVKEILKKAWRKNSQKFYYWEEAQVLAQFWTKYIGSFKSVHLLLHGPVKVPLDFALRPFVMICLFRLTYSFKCYLILTFALSPWFFRYFRDAENQFASIVNTRRKYS